MTLSHAHVRTKSAGRYLLWLSNRSHRAPQSRAVILFPIGRCELVASDDYLDIEISANSLSMASLIEDAISDRLDALALDEELHYQWVVAPEAKEKAPRSWLARKTSADNTDAGDSL